MRVPHYLEPVPPRRVGHGASLSGRIDIRVRSTSIAVHVALLLELHSVLLRVRRTERAITREIPHVAQDRRLLRRLIMRPLASGTDNDTDRNDL